MQALDKLDARGVRGLLFDIDDTLTSDGSLSAGAYAALEAVHGAGLLAVPITGRPAGWCDHIARMWPVDAVVGENGAFWFAYEREARRLHKHFSQSELERGANRARLLEIGRRIVAAVPGCAFASDQAYRETDLAIDFCEDVPALPLEVAERIAGLMRAAGMTAKISSIHVNGWFGDYDKLGLTRRLLADRFACPPDAARSAFVFAGDSPNDAPMFEYFERSVGVANVRRFAGRLAAEPKYVTPSESGAGFAELAAHLLAAR